MSGSVALSSNVFDLMTSYLTEEVTKGPSVMPSVKSTIEAMKTFFTVVALPQIDEQIRREKESRENSLRYFQELYAPHMKACQDFIVKYVSKAPGNSILIVSPHLIEKPIFARIIAPFQTVIIRAISRESIEGCLAQLTPDERARHTFWFQCGDLSSTQSELNRIALEQMQFGLSFKNVFTRLNGFCSKMESSPEHAMQENLKRLIRRIGKVDCILSCLNISSSDSFTGAAYAFHFNELFKPDYFGVEEACIAWRKRMYIHTQTQAFAEAAEILKPEGCFVYLDTINFIPPKPYEIVEPQALQKKAELFEESDLESHEWTLRPTPRTVFQVNKSVLRRKFVPFALRAACSIL